jgi:hypothetical protein
MDMGFQQGAFAGVIITPKIGRGACIYAPDVACRFQQFRDLAQLRFNFAGDTLQPPPLAALCPHICSSTFACTAHDVRATLQAQGLRPA